MNQKKIGVFLKTLRKEKDMSQEQLAERFSISNRTVSRLETGNNMPDLSILIELADFYDVDIREIIDGERKNENMNSEIKDTLKKVSEYSEVEKSILKKRIIGLSLLGFIVFLLYCVLELTQGFNMIPESILFNIEDFLLGATVAIYLLNIVYLLGGLDKIREFKLGIVKSSKI